jgi:hypothetical protein
MFSIKLDGIIDFSMWDSFFQKTVLTIMLEPVIEPNALYRYHTVSMYQYGPLVLVCFFMYCNCLLFLTPGHLPSNTTPLQEIMRLALGCVLLLMVKNHLKELYGFTDRYACMAETGGRDRYACMTETGGRDRYACMTETGMLV